MRNALTILLVILIALAGAVTGALLTSFGIVTLSLLFFVSLFVIGFLMSANIISSVRDETIATLYAIGGLFFLIPMWLQHIAQLIGNNFSLIR
jgi:hypothetical protein